MEFLYFNSATKVIKESVKSMLEKSKEKKAIESAEKVEEVEGTIEEITDESHHLKEEWTRYVNRNFNLNWKLSTA